MDKNAVPNWVPLAGRKALVVDSCPKLPHKSQDMMWTQFLNTSYFDTDVY